MKRIYKNSDIKLDLTSLKGIEGKFIIKFYTTNKEFFIRKTDQDVVVEDEKIYLKLNWSELEVIGDGVLNYVINFISPDADYDDGKFNNTISKTTDYYICSNVQVTEEETESIVDIVAELGVSLNEEIARSTSKDTEHDDAITNMDMAAAQALVDLNDRIGIEAQVRTQTDTILSQSIQEAKEEVESTIKEIDTVTSFALTDLNERVSDSDRVATQALNNLNDRLTYEAQVRTQTDNILSQSIQEAKDEIETTVSEVDTVTSYALNDLKESKADKGEAYTKSESDSKYVVAANLAEVATSGDYNDLTNLPTIPAAQVQADWNVTSSSSKAYIKHKPTIPTVPTNVSAFTNDAGYLTQHQDISTKQDKITIVNHGTNDTTFTLTPNVYHIWGTVASLTLTLGNGTGYFDEYMFEFTSGTTPTVLNVPNSVKWVNDPISIESNMRYQVSIANNIGLIVGVSV